MPTRTFAMWFYLQIWRSRQQKLCWPQSQPTGAPWQKLVVHYVLQFDRKTEQSPKNMSTAPNTRTHINLNHLSRLDSSPRWRSPSPTRGIPDLLFVFLLTINFQLYCFQKLLFCRTEAKKSRDRREPKWNARLCFH